jgi:5-formyltetrahydrofolate cyclo-ligase
MEPGVVAVRQEKAAIRKTALARRDALDVDERLRASRALTNPAASYFGSVAGKTVSGFWPIRSEIDPRWIMRELVEQGATLALPCIEDGQLVFRHFAFGDRLRRTGFGLLEPSPGAVEATPAMMLVPMAAFDRRGGRIGYGKGYYDGAIARLVGLGRRPRLLGLAFACQEARSIPLEPHDQRLDAILTERELILS